MDYDTSISTPANGVKTPLAGTLAGNAMQGIPIPNIQGGDAAPSSSYVGDTKTYVNAVSGASGTIFIIAIFSVIGLIIWKKMK